jgi:protein CrcB
MERARHEFQITALVGTRSQLLDVVGSGAFRTQNDRWPTMTYVWIGIGGALGSMARAWLALAVSRLAGAQFPWGTILINILGSFVIGFFGTLTTNDSRFAAPADLRAFVMVGICGGFTTFSSFSLQTLELARDGRIAQAIGNIGLSVICCLLAVTAGYFGADAINGGRAAPAVTGDKATGSEMGEVVIAVLNDPAEAEQLLDAGAHWLALAGGGRLKALAIRTPPAAAILPSEEVLTASREASIRAEQEHWSEGLRTTFAAWAHGRSRNVHTDWLDVEGDSAEIITNHGRQADAIVVARTDDHESERMRNCLHAALFDTETPVLVVPSSYRGQFGRIVAIAWKNDERAVKAVRASLPILRQAETVHVLCAGDVADAPVILEDHDILFVLQVIPKADGATGLQLLEAAHEVGADLIVMGAFAHGEWRERMFGGVTRTMLAEADLPLLMRQ